MLANGMGGVDWAGLGLAVEVLGVQDVEELVDALVTIKTHSAPEGARD